MIHPNLLFSILNVSIECILYFFSLVVLGDGKYKFSDGKAIFIRIVKEQKNDGNDKNNGCNIINSISLHITQREPNEIPDKYIFDTIINDGTLEELKKKVENVWKRIEDIKLI